MKTKVMGVLYGELYFQSLPSRIAPIIHPANSHGAMNTALVNYLGCVYPTLHAMQYLKKSPHRGQIVVNSSEAGIGW